MTCQRPLIALVALLAVSCASRRAQPSPVPSTNPSGRNMGAVDVLTSTEGVDFGPYLGHVLHDIKLNWYNRIPEAARAPLMKKGKVSIEFAILKDGRVTGMKLTEPSGDIALDRAAWDSITARPLPPLPGEFRGQYLALRFHFYYNP